jgi:hypothetical protein
MQSFAARNGKSIEGVSRGHGHTPRFPCCRLDRERRSATPFHAVELIPRPDPVIAIELETARHRFDRSSLLGRTKPIT